MEDVGAVPMHEHARLMTLGEAVAADMIACIKHVTNMPSFGEFSLRR